MKSKLAQFVKQNLFPILLVLIALILVIQNYTPTTYLSGWDTLHPEFNYKLYWTRIIDGVWQEHQGLGAVGSQAHPAEIPRVLTIMLFDLILPTSMVRYAYAFLMLVLGPLGMYFFMKKGVFAKHEPTTKIEIASFLAGLFYLLNLVTLQHYYVPLEMFLTHYGYLGFFMLALLKCLQHASRKNLTCFALVTFLMAPQAHTSTLFFSLVIFAGAYTFIYWSLNRFSKQILKNALKLVILLFAVNAFWLLPNLYFIKNHGAQVQESKIQRLFNEEAFLQNNSFGDIQNIALGKGFLFNWGEHDGNLGYKTLLDEWRTYQRNTYVMYAGYALFAFVLLGIIASFRHKNKEALAVLGILLVSMFFLFGTNPPTGVFYDLFADNIKMFKDAFRFNFTKFSISLVFAYSVFFGVFILSTQNAFSRFMKTTKYQKLVQSTILLLFSSILVVWMLPAFKGYLISPSMRVQIPDHYFEMFEFFDAQQGFGRVADLPINSFWGWIYYDWPNQQYSYQGAGFLWFGIKQPLMNREFDRWNPINQSYYNEMTQAIYSQNTIAVEEVMEKYKIRYILLDKSVVAPGHNQQTLFTQQIVDMLYTSKKLKLAKEFGDLMVYEYLPGKNFTLNEVVAASKYTIEDPQTLNQKIELSSEELDPAFISSDESNVYFTLTKPYDSMPANTRVPYSVSYVLDNNTLTLTFDNLLVSEAVPDITTQLEFAKSSEDVELTVSINTSDFSLEPSSTTGELGQVFLPTNTNVSVSISESTPTDVNVNELTSNLESCSEEGQFATFEYSKTSDGLVLSGKNIDACVSAKLTSLLEPNDLTFDRFKIHIQGAFKDLPCIYSLTAGLCENVPETVETSYLRMSEPADKYVLRLFSKGYGSDKEVKSTYKSIQLSPLKVLTTGTVSVPQNAVSITYVNPAFTKNKFLGGNIGELSSKTRYCKSGEPYAAVYSQDLGLNYSTSEDEICTSIELPYASHQDGYILEVRSKFISGMPLRFCLTNEFSKRCDKYVELSKQLTPTTQFYLVPPIGKEKGFTFNISALSFGGVKSQSTLYYVALTPISYDLIAQSSFEPVSVGQSDKVYVHNQAFEKGWTLFCGLSPCDAEHILVNGWANGWILPAYTATDSLTVIFWPQLLEYIGFGILLCLGIVLLVSRKNKS